MQIKTAVSSAHASGPTGIDGLACGWNTEPLELFNLPGKRVKWRDYFRKQFSSFLQS